MIRPNIEEINRRKKDSSKDTPEAHLNEVR